MYYPSLLCKHRPLTVAPLRERWRNGGEDGTLLVLSGERLGLLAEIHDLPQQLVAAVGLDPVVLSQCLRFGTKAAQKTLPRYLIVCFFFPFAPLLLGWLGHRVRDLVWNQDLKEVAAVGPSWKKKKKTRLDLKFFFLGSRHPHPPFTHCSVSVFRDFSRWRVCVSCIQFLKPVYRSQ